jgi:virulence-associated protein VagC
MRFSALLNLEKGSRVDMFCDGDKIIITPIREHATIKKFDVKPVVNQVPFEAPATKEMGREWKRVRCILNDAPSCQICNKKIVQNYRDRDLIKSFFGISTNKGVKHHTSYKENKTVIICKSCHGMVHLGKKYKHLQPTDEKEQ